MKSHFLPYPDGTHDFDFQNDCHDCQTEADQLEDFFQQLKIKTLRYGNKMVIVEAQDVKDLLTNPDQLQQVISRIKLKSFW